MKTSERVPSPTCTAYQRVYSPFYAALGLDSEHTLVGARSVILADVVYPRLFKLLDDSWLQRNSCPPRREMLAARLLAPDSPVMQRHGDEPAAVQLSLATHAK